MHQHSLAAAGVEGCVVKPQALSVSDMKGDGQARRLGSPTRLEDHGFTEVDAYRRTGGTHEPGDLEYVRTHAAANIGDVLTIPKPKSVEDGALGSNDVGEGVAKVEESNEEVGIASAIDICE
jgi:hypothetical protein